jgi:DNA-binding XRE family transcriptional regulator
METAIFLFTKSLIIKKSMKEITHRIHARMETIENPTRISAFLSKKEDCPKVILLDLKFPEIELNRTIFYLSQFKEEFPVVLLGSQHSTHAESEAMRNLNVYVRMSFENKYENKKELEKVLENLHLELDMDKKLEKVDYLEQERVFVCTFRNMKKFFLNRSDIPDDVKGGVSSVEVDPSGAHFMATYSTGETSIVPWDFVRALCDDSYEYYKQVPGSTTDDIGQKIKNHRQFLRLTQQDLADKTNIQRANIARIEAGKHSPSLLTLEKIAEALKIPVAQLLGKK